MSLRDRVKDALWWHTPVLTTRGRLCRYKEKAEKNAFDLGRSYERARPPVSDVEALAALTVAIGNAKRPVSGSGGAMEPRSGVEQA